MEFRENIVVHFFISKKNQDQDQSQVHSSSAIKADLEPR